MSDTIENNESLDKYLDKISEFLRYMDADEQAETRVELRMHLYALFVELQRGGMTSEEAAAAALKKFGSARHVGTRIGDKSVKHFLRSLDQAVPVRFRWLRKSREIITLACFIPMPAEFIVGDSSVFWPYYLAFAGGLVVGVLYGIDQPQEPDERLWRILDEAEEKLAKEVSEHQTFRASFKHFLAMQALKWMRYQNVIGRSRSVYQPLSRLNWQFYYTVAFGCVAWLLAPNLRGLLDHLLIWQVLWLVAQGLSEAMTRMIRDRFLVESPN